MKIRYPAIAVAAIAALLLGGCATYGYRGGSGDYYYGQSYRSGYYGAPYGSVGYGTYGGFRGSIGYGYPGSFYRPVYVPRSIYYGPRYPAYGYYPPYHHGRPIERPRPGTSRPPRESRPNAPWRNLQDATRAEHRGRPGRVEGGRAARPRAEGHRERVRPPNPAGRRPEAQSSRGSPWRAGPARQQGGPTPERVRSAPGRQSPPPARQRTSPAPSRRANPGPRSQERDRGSTQAR